MDKNIVSTFKFLDYHMSDMEFKLNQCSASEMNDDADLDMEFEVIVGRKKDCPEQIKLSVVVNVFKDYIEKGAPFNLQFTIDGYFEIEKAMTDEELTQFCKSSGVPILFPYIRSAVTDITKVANVEPLILPLINVRKIVERPELIKDAKSE